MKNPLNPLKNPYVKLSSSAKLLSSSFLYNVNITITPTTFTPSQPPTQQIPITTTTESATATRSPPERRLRRRHHPWRFIPIRATALTLPRQHCAPRQSVPHENVGHNASEAGEGGQMAHAHNSPPFTIICRLNCRQLSPVFVAAGLDR